MEKIVDWLERRAGGRFGQGEQPPKGPALPRRDNEMNVDVDDVWATSSTLHLRVTVSGEDYAWRHRYYPAIPLAEIPEEAITAIYGFYLDAQPEEDHEQSALF